MTNETQPENTALDFSSLELANSASEMPVVHPSTGEPMEINGKLVIINVRSVDSEEYRKVERIQQNRRLKNAGKIAAGKLKIDAKELEDERYERLEVLVAGWSNIVEAGKEIPYSKATCLPFLRKHAWLQRQIFDYAEDLANFTR